LDEEASMLSLVITLLSPRAGAHLTTFTFYKEIVEEKERRLADSRFE
jgi:hypothetical protein